MNRFVIAAILALSPAGPAAATGIDATFSGRVDLGYRYYVEDGQYAGQQDSGFYPYLGFTLNGALPLGGGEIVLQFSGLNDDENDRSLFNPQKAYYTQSFGNLDLVVGYNVEDWGVSNGRTILNVLNAKNQTNQIRNSDLIGTPMANANIFTDLGTFSLYVLGDSIEANFGGRATRQRGPFFIDDRLIQYEDGNSTDIAVRYTNSFSLGEASLDLSASIYDGTSREALRMPACVDADRTVSAAECARFNQEVVDSYEAGATPIEAAISVGAGPLTAVAPYYQEIRQYGMTAVYARSNTQLRFEGLMREAAGEGFVAAIVGGDHSFFNFLGGDGTLTLALEYHYDDRSDRQPNSVYDDDLFLGVNYSLNDANDSRVDFGMFYDLEESSRIYTLSASRRIGDRVRVSINANHIDAESVADPLSTVDGDSYVEFTLSTFF